MVSTYGKLLGDPGFIPRADFDENGRMSIVDFSVVAHNYGDQGPLTDWPVWVSNGTATAESVGACMSGGEPSGPESTVTLYLTPSSYATRVGTIFEMIIRVNSGIRLLDGVETHVNFDQSKLRVVNAQGQPVHSIPPGTTFQEVLKNTVGNGGTIDFSEGGAEESPFFGWSFLGAPTLGHFVDRLPSTSLPLIGTIVCHH